MNKKMFKIIIFYFLCFRVFINFSKIFFILVILSFYGIKFKSVNSLCDRLLLAIWHFENMNVLSHKI